MSNENRSTKKELSELFEDFKEYLDMRYDLLRLSASEWIIKFLFPLCSLTVILVLVSMLLLFLSFSAAYYIGDLLCSVPLGFVVISLVYLLFILLFFALRKYLVMRPLAKFVIKMFFHKD